MAEIARGERFSLLAVEGYAIIPDSHLSPKHPTISYCIVDRALNHQEVWRDYHGDHGRNYGTRLGRRTRSLEKLHELEIWEKRTT